MIKPAFCICENKVTAKLVSAFVFATRIVQSLYLLHPKCQASSHLLWLYIPVCVGPGRKPRRPVFSQRGSNDNELIFIFRPSSIPLSYNSTLFEPRHTKTCLRGFRPGPTQSGPYSRTMWLQIRKYLCTCS